ncbi:hypothetical protein OG21DRAFT_1411501 [Imleria badia]|nr:hypothetical protein OG21DRAFT_1411501 [Imleria badia]
MTVPSLTSEQAIPARSHPEHVVSWYHVYWNAVIVNGPRTFVPQTIYQPHSQGDKERYVSLAKLHPPIIFFAQGSPEWGIPIQHLLCKQSVGLVDGSEPAFGSCGPSIGIRLQWPGYQPCHKQVPTRDYTHERRMISKAKLAQVVARSVKQFMDAMTGKVMEVGSDTQWRVGPLGIRADDIILVSLHHVSQGSWQPQLRLRRPITPNVVQDRRVIAPDTRIRSRALGD